MQKAMLTHVNKLHLLQNINTIKNFKIVKPLRLAIMLCMYITLAKDVSSTSTRFNLHCNRHNIYNINVHMYFLSICTTYVLESTAAANIQFVLHFWY